MALKGFPNGDIKAILVTTIEDIYKNYIDVHF